MLPMNNVKRKQNIENIRIRIFLYYIFRIIQSENILNTRENTYNIFVDLCTGLTTIFSRSSVRNTPQPTRTHPHIVVPQGKQTLGKTAQGKKLLSPHFLCTLITTLCQRWTSRSILPEWLIWLTNWSDNVVLLVYHAYNALKLDQCTHFTLSHDIM